MVKKKKKVKKTPKKVVAKKKAAKKKVVKKKATKGKKGGKKGGKKTIQIVYAENYNLHIKKLNIMASHPIMPCSAIAKGRDGAYYAYTEACKVYATYFKACLEARLVIRRITGRSINAEYDESWKDKEGVWHTVKIACVRYEGTWEIMDVETGEKETFDGAGDGNNYIWSCNSAQTVAKKQALLDYFEAAWPQPNDFTELIREEIAGLAAPKFVEQVRKMMPEPGSKDAERLNAEGAMKAIMQFFADY